MLNATEMMLPLRPKSGLAARISERDSRRAIAGASRLGSVYRRGCRRQRPMGETRVSTGSERRRRRLDCVGSSCECEGAPNIGTWMGLGLDWGSEGYDADQVPPEGKWDKEARNSGPGYGHQRDWYRGCVYWCPVSTGFAGLLAKGGVVAHCCCLLMPRFVCSRCGWVVKRIVQTFKRWLWRNLKQTQRKL